MSSEIQQPTEVFIMSRDGLGFGEGTISAKEIASLEVIDTGLEVIADNEATLFSVVRMSDGDGCGDGRKAKRWYKKLDGLFHNINQPLVRAKLFGAGLTAAASMWRTIRGAPKHDSSVDETVFGDRSEMAGLLKSETQMAYGSHIDDHEHVDGQCGCGAMDNYEKISRNIIVYRDKIENVLKALYGGQYEAAKPYIEYVFNHYTSLLQDEKYFEDVQGEKTQKLVEDEGSIISELEGPHLEGFLVLNDVEGTTFSQAQFEALLRGKLGLTREDEDEVIVPQAFVVDLWRGRQYAETVAKLAVSHGVSKDREQARQIAYADFLIRTLATSATLTKGDQAVVVRRSPHKKDFSLAV